MKIIISPAKKMNEDTHTLEVRDMPIFLEKAEALCQVLRSLTYEEKKQVWNCNDEIASLNERRFNDMNLKRGLTPAILSYEGLQYQHIAPFVLTDHALEYIQEHLRIISGFYGILRPFDGIVPYRLEMQAKLSIENYKNLYQYWGNKIYDALCETDHIIVNLASKEYSKVIEKYLTPQDQMITCQFVEEVDGKLKQKGTFAKMARGEMVRYLAENQIHTLDGIKAFHAMDYMYSEKESTEKEYVFVRIKHERTC